MITMNCLSGRRFLACALALLFGCTPYDSTLLPGGSGVSQIDGSGSGGKEGVTGGTGATTGAGGFVNAGGQAGTDVSDATIDDQASLDDAVGSGGSIAEDVAPEIGPTLPGPLLHYKFDETVGAVVADSSGNSNDGICNGTYAWVAGQIGNAISLDGKTGYVALPAGVLGKLTEMTVATWVALDVTANWQRIFDFGNRRLNDAGAPAIPLVYMFLTSQSGTAKMRFAITTTGASGETLLDGANALPVGTWKHVAVTFNAQTGSLYEDGVLVRAITPFTLTPMTLGATTHNWIGRSLYNVDPYFKGKIDDFRIYDRVLSANEISVLAAR
jgi:Concanavalin A-like lectin/glucanases superfamily